MFISSELGLVARSAGSVASALVDGALHRGTGDWNHILNDIAFLDSLVPFHIGLLMLLEQGDDPPVDRASVIARFQPVQHPSQPASNIFFPPTPHTRGVTNVFHELSLLGY